MIVQFVFGWAASNMNSLSMEPLGAVAGTAASVFGFIQTVGGALLGTMIGCSSTARRRRSRSATSSWARRAWLRAHRRERQAVRRRQGVRRRPLGLLVDPADAQPVHDELS